MLNRIIDLSVRGRWLVLLLVLVLSIFGARELLRLPIDAVPDITNRQVQINTIAPALGPEEVESQVTYPLETALAGLPGLTETRSLSRHGFSQITAVFTAVLSTFVCGEPPLMRTLPSASTVMLP